MYRGAWLAEELECFVESDMLCFVALGGELPELERLVEFKLELP